MNNHQPSTNVFDALIEKQRQILRKLEEVKAKIENLNQTRKELIELTKNIEEEIYGALIVIEYSSESD